MIVSCQTSLPETPTVTSTAVSQPLFISPQTTPITIAELAARPEDFAGQHLIITGQYQNLPQLICQQDPHPSPAAWGVVADGFIAYASGFTQIRPLLPDDLTMTIEGYWRHWQGAIGCGKQAIYQEVWYLEVTRILDPSPVVQVTLTPLGGLGDLIAQAGQTATPAASGTTPTATPAELPIIEPPEAEATPVNPIPTLAEAPITATPTLPSSGELPPATPTLDTAVTPFPPTDEESKEPTPTTPGNTPDPSGTPGNPGTPSATHTPGDISTPGTSTPTATPIIPGTPGTPTATAIPSPTPIVEDQGEITDMFLSTQPLAAGHAHRWQLEITAGDTITMYAAAVTADLILTLYDPGGTLLTQQNGTSSGQPERLTQILPSTGLYQVQISSVGQIATDYAFIFGYQNSYPFVLRGTLTYGGNAANISLLAENDHFWHFMGTAGDHIRLQLTPVGNADLFMKLYDPAAEDITGFIDEQGAGEVEIFTFTLPDTGLYSVRVGEFEYLAAEYTLSLSEE